MRKFEHWNYDLNSGASRMEISKLSNVNEKEIKRRCNLKLEEKIEIKKVIILKSLGYANKIKKQD